MKKKNKQKGVPGIIAIVGEEPRTIEPDKLFYQLFFTVGIVMLGVFTFAHFDDNYMDNLLDKYEEPTQDEFDYNCEEDPHCLFAINYNDINTPEEYDDYKKQLCESQGYIVEEKEDCDCAKEHKYCIVYDPMGFEHYLRNQCYGTETFCTNPNSCECPDGFDKYIRISDLKEDCANINKTFCNIYDESGKCIAGYPLETIECEPKSCEINSWINKECSLE